MLRLFKLTFWLLGVSLCLSLSAYEDYEVKHKKLSKNRTGKQYEVAIAAIFWNPEVPYLKEWIEYHKLIGVEHFYLYNNIWWSDDSGPVLQPYIQQGLVTVIPWKCKPDHLGVWDPGQRAAYNDALSRARNQAKWLAIIDIDEFIVPTSTNNLRVFLQDFSQYPAVLINWQCFGTSNFEYIPSNKLMTECLTYKFPKGHGMHCGVKSIVQPKYIIDMLVHFPNTIDVEACKADGLELFAVNEHAYRMEGGSTDKIQLNHYWYRTENYWHQVKLPLRNKWYPGTNNAEYFGNMRFEATVEDLAISPYLPALRAAMGLQP